MKSTLVTLFSLAVLVARGFAMDALQVSIHPEQRLLPVGEGREVVIQIDLNSTEHRQGKRVPLNVAVVLDRSSSMSGAKLEKARQAAAGIVEQLRRNDVFSLVTYSHEVQVLIPAGPMRDSEAVQKKIQQIQAGGSTALHAGVKEGGAQALTHHAADRLTRLILLSDGLANVGPSSPDEVGRLGRELAKKGIPVSTIGVGDDYNEDLMTALAEESDANYYYVRDAENLPEIFARELGGMLGVSARNVRLRITCSNGVEAIGLLGRGEQFKNGTATVDLAPFVPGQSRKLLARFRIPAGTQVATQEVARIELTYSDPEHGEISRTSEVSIAWTEDLQAAERSIDADVRAERELVMNALETDAAVEKADKGEVKAAVEQLRKAAQKLEKAALSAPESRKAELLGEARAQVARAEILDREGMQKPVRKEMKSSAYKTRNSKK
jgi:Ca-activated chloride channel family protein